MTGIRNSATLCPSRFILLGLNGFHQALVLSYGAANS